jgi:hypothetical protein
MVSHRVCQRLKCAATERPAVAAEPAPNKRTKMRKSTDSCLACDAKTREATVKDSMDQARRQPARHAPRRFGTAKRQAGVTDLTDHQPR